MSVLVDTSVWADHLRQSDDRLMRVLAAGLVRMHPFVTGELALGNLRNRDRTIAMLNALDPVSAADPADLLAFIADHDLAGSGIGFVDTHLLAAAAKGGMRLWTRDRKLATRAEALGLAWQP